MTPRAKWLAGILGIWLAVHAWAAVGNVTMDGDTLRLAGQLVHAPSLRDALSALGSRVVLYPSQPPILWATARAGALLRPGWNPLSAARLWTLLATGAIAWLLFLLAGEAGAGPAGRIAAAGFPFLWHGFSFMLVSCDDNGVADALTLAVLLAAVRWLNAPAGGRRHLYVGLALGGALSWHFQCTILFPAVGIAGFAAWRREGSSRLRETGQALALGVAVWAAVLATCVAGSRAPAPLGALAAAMAGNHHDPKLWFPASGRSLAEQAGLVWEGWSRMVLGFRWLRPAGGGLWVATVLGLLGAAGALAGPALAGTALGRVMAPVLALWIGHSLLYESESIERWDVPAMLSGLGVVAAVAAGRGRRLAAVGGVLAGLLLAGNVTGWVRFARGAEPAFLDVVEGRRVVDGMGLDCIGAHWRLCRAAREFALVVKPWDGMGDVVQAKVPDVYHQYWMTGWFATYLACYAPDFTSRRGSVSFCLLSPPSSARFRILRQEGFVYLIDRLPPRSDR